MLIKHIKAIVYIKGEKNDKDNYNLDIKELDINDQDENYEKNNKYYLLKNNLKKNNIYNYNINGQTDIDYSLSDSQDNTLKNIKKINSQTNNKKDNNDSDELSDLADELVETFNIGKFDVEVDTHNIFDEKVRANINEENNSNNDNNKMGEIYQKSKSSNIYYDKNNILNSIEYKQINKDLNKNKNNKNNIDINKTNEKKEQL